MRICVDLWQRNSVYPLNTTARFMSQSFHSRKFPRQRFAWRVGGRSNNCSVTSAPGRQRTVISNPRAEILLSRCLPNFRAFGETRVRVDSSSGRCHCEWVEGWDSEFKKFVAAKRRKRRKASGFLPLIFANRTLIFLGLVEDASGAANE